MTFAADHRSAEIALAKKVGAEVRRLRHMTGLSQAAFAYTVPLSPNYVARVERGEVGMGFRVAVNVAEALGVTVSDLLDGPG